jgi:hypothetical protein
VAAISTNLPLGKASLTRQPGPNPRIAVPDEYGIECLTPMPPDYLMPKSVVILAILFLLLAGVMLLSLSVFDRSYQDLGVGGCVLLGAAVIAAAIVGPTAPR